MNFWRKTPWWGSIVVILPAQRYYSLTLPFHMLFALDFSSFLLLAEGCSFSVLKHCVHDIIVSSPPPLSSDTMSTSPAKTVVGFDVVANKIWVLHRVIHPPKQSTHVAVMSFGQKVNLRSPRVQVSARLTPLLLPQRLQNNVDEKGHYNQLRQTKGKWKIECGGGTLRGRGALRG